MDDPTLDDAEEDRIDWFAADIEAMRAGIPWRPPIALILAVGALPIISLILTGVVAERASVEATAQLPLVDAWRALAALALLVGSVLVAAVPLVARAARGRANVTLAVLRHGFPIGVLGVAVLVVLHTLLAYGILLAAQYLIVGTVTPSLPAIVLFAGLASAVYLATTGAGALRETSIVDPTAVVGRDEAPGLHRLVERLSERVGVPPPDAVLLGASMDAWTGVGRVMTGDGPVNGTVLRLPLGPLAVLPVSSVEAIVAHELGHISNGDTVEGARVAPTFVRLAAAIDALRTETSTAGRIAAAPALTWLGYASDIAMGIIGEQRRASESAADDVAIATVGAETTAAALLALEVTDAFADEWATIVDDALRSPDIDPAATFAGLVRDAAPEIAVADVIDGSVYGTGPFHPALVTRLAAAGVREPRLDLAEPSALDVLVPDRRAIVDRVLDAVRPEAPAAGAADGDRAEPRNAPRLTPGTVAWVIVGVVFAAIFVNRIAIFGASSDETIQIVVVIAGIWLLYPLVYPWLQREIVVDRSRIRIRTWWSQLLDRTGGDRGWHDVAWTGSMTMTVGFESIATLSNGARTVRWWAGIWPKRELTQLVDDLRARGAFVRFTSDFGERDHARHAVVWYAGDRFLVPDVRMTHEGEVLEIRPAKVVRPGAVPLMSALVDHLHDPVRPVGAKDRRADPSHLASLVDLDETAFAETARRFTVERNRQGWTIRLDGEPGTWTVDRRSDEADLAEIILGILGLESTAFGWGSRGPDDDLEER